MDKTQDALDLYFLTRNVVWRYKLDQYEDATIAEMLKTVRSAVAEIKREIFDGDAPANADALVAELEALSAGLRRKIGEDVATMSGVAAEYSATEHSAIMSLDGAAKINTVALSAAQFQSFLGGSSGGTPLPQWVDDAWGHVVSDQIKRNLNVAVLRGEGYQKAVRGLLDSTIADFTEREAVTIARTYVQTANVAAQMAVYQENDDLVKGWKWSAVLEPGYAKSGRGTCLRCASLDQRQFKMGEGPPIPLHPRCLTGETPVNAPDKVAAFVAPYSGPIIEIGLPDGTSISVTPNHMFLTDKGFVPAKSLNERSKIFYNAGANGPVGLVGPDDHGKPAPIKEIVEAMAKAPGMVTIRVPHAAEYFHGDGGFFQGYVDVIAPDCFLRREGDTTIPEQGPEGELIFSDVVKLALSPECDFTQPLLWLWLATHCHVSGKSVSDVLLPSPSRHHQPVRLCLSSADNANLIKSALNDYSGNTKMLRDGVSRHSRVVHPDHIVNGNVFFVPGRDDGLSVDGLNPVSLQDRGNSTGVNGEVLGDFARRFSGQITLTNLSFVRVGHFSGHVYDLQTLSSMYHVAGAVSSNCRCVALPITKSWRELGIDRDEIEQAIRPYTIRPDQNIDAGGMRTIIESGRHQGDYASWWAKQPEAFKINAVGPGRFELLESGKIEFGDLVDSRGRQRTLEELGKLR